MDLLPTIARRLTDALSALPDAGSPHVTRSDVGERLVLRTVAGARFEVGPVQGPPSLDRVAAAVAEHLDDLEHEPYDLYVREQEGVAAVEIRSLAGRSVLQVEVRSQGVTLHASVVQHDEMRWQAEEDGHLGDDFQDFAERNALWAGLGGPRPRGWVLTVVEPGEPRPALFAARRSDG